MFQRRFCYIVPTFFPCRPLLSRVYLLCALRDPQKPQGLRELRHYPMDSFVFAVVKINKYNFLRVDLNFLKDKNMEALNKAIFQCQSSSDTLHPLSPDSSWSVCHTASIQFQSLISRRLNSAFHRFKLFRYGKGFWKVCLCMHQWCQYIALPFDGPHA